MATELAFWDRFRKQSDSFVSSLNGCFRPFGNRRSNARHLIDDLETVAKIEFAFSKRDPSSAFSDADIAMMSCAEKLAIPTSEMIQSDIQALRDAGVDDERSWKSSGSIVI